MFFFKLYDSFMLMYYVIFNLIITFVIKLLDVINSKFFYIK